MSGRFQRASTDEELVKIIISGIAGTAMPPNNYSDLEAGMIVAYLRGTAAGDSVDRDGRRQRARQDAVRRQRQMRHLPQRDVATWRRRLSDIGTAAAAARARTVDPRSERDRSIPTSASFARHEDRHRRHRTPAQPEHLLGADSRHAPRSCARSTDRACASSRSSRRRRCRRPAACSTHRKSPTS